MAEAWQRDEFRPKFGDSRGVCGVVRSGVGISSLPLALSSSQQPNPLQITFTFSGVHVAFLST